MRRDTAAVTRTIGNVTFGLRLRPSFKYESVPKTASAMKNIATMIGLCMQKRVSHMLESSYGRA